MKLLKTIFAILFLVLITSCSSDNGESATDSPTGGSNTSNTVFAVGHEEKDITKTPVIWTNGVKKFLPILANTVVDDLKIEVENNDVYVIGVETTSNNKRSVVLWKNGVQSRFSQSADYVSVEQMIVDNGNVYVLGSERLAGDVIKLRYWKNGVATTIINGGVLVSNDFKENYIDKMVVVNNDVHCIGSEWNSTGTNLTAKYWKNGVATTIMVEKNIYDYLVDIQVNGTEVSILYNQMNATTFKQEVKVWKNNTVSVIANGNNGFLGIGMVIEEGVEHILVRELMLNGTKLWYLKNRVKTEITDGTFDLEDCLFKVDGSNVCVAYLPDLGSNNVVKYWLNNTTKSFNSVNRFEFDFVFLAGKDVYMTSARSFEGPEFWINGVKTTLSFDATKDHTSIDAIFVTKK